MTAATVNKTEKVFGIVGLTYYDLTFAATADTHTVTFPVRTFTWGLKTATTDGTKNEYQLNESAGVFTLTVNGTAASVRVNLWAIEQK